MFTIDSFGGCGIVTALVTALGNPVGYATINVRSPDIMIDQALATRAFVNIADLAALGVLFPSPPKTYSPCADYQAPQGTVNLADFASFGTHWQHGDPAGGGNPSFVSGIASSGGGIQLVFEEDTPLVGSRTFRASVALSGVEPFRAVVIAVGNENPTFRYKGWTANDGFDGTTMCTEVVRDERKQVFLAAVGDKGGSSGNLTLGTIEFEIVSSDPLDLKSSDFEILAGEILGVNGTAMQVAGMPERSSPQRVYRDELAQNYPNPFNPQTTISFSIANGSNVELTVFDLTGALVKTLVHERRNAGVHRVPWDGHNQQGQRVASGVYFYKLVAGSFTDTKKMTILK